MDTFDPYALPGVKSLVKHLKQGNLWAKFSGAFRVEPSPLMKMVEPMAKEILHIQPDSVIFATDWPHTRFEGTDITSFANACLRWCESQPGLAEELFRRNAEVLWDVRV